MKELELPCKGSTDYMLFSMIDGELTLSIPNPFDDEDGDEITLCLSAKNVKRLKAFIEMQVN
jgi:hypothetical protein